MKRLGNLDFGTLVTNVSGVGTQATEAADQLKAAITAQLALSALAALGIWALLVTTSRRGI
jgi:hypothetical protein